MSARFVAAPPATPRGARFAGRRPSGGLAALKQVPACEYNPFEAVQTNVLGAENVIAAAIDNGVR